MNINFDRWECREGNGVITVLFDVEGFDGNIVVSIQRETLLKHIREEELNWGYPLEPDDYVQISSVLTWWIDHKEDVIKHYIFEKLK